MTIWRTSIVRALLVSLGWLWMASGIAAETPAPRPISEAEGAAVALAVDYLTEGPDSWWPYLSRQSPLRALGRKAAKREIAVRCGPAKGATWRLQASAPRWEDVVVFRIEYPSGLEESLSLEMVEEDGWKIAHVRILSEPPPPRLGVEEMLSSSSAADPGPLIPMAMGVFLVAVLVAFMGRTRHGVMAWRFAWASAVMPLIVVWSCTQVEEIESRETFVRLAPLLTLREITAAGGVDPEPLFAELPTSGLVGKVGHSWEAAYRILRFELNEAQSILDTFPSPAGNAAIELLRARLGFLRSDEVETLLGFEKALEVGPDHDGLRLEMAQSHVQLGFLDKSHIVFELLRSMGSREPDVYYTLARFAVYEGREDDAEELFRTAWELQPVERDEVFSDPFLAYLATRPAIFPLLELSSVAEPTVIAEATGTHPLEFRIGTEARLSGESLELKLGEATLMVPGGSALAGAGTVVEDAGARRRREERRALDRLPSLVEATRTPGALAQPLLRRQARVAALALLRDNQWEELIELTDGLVGSVDHAPPILAKLRARALTEKGRNDDATDVLLALARSDLEKGRQDPATLYQLAEVFATEEDYDLAVRLLRKAESLSPFEPDYRRLQRFRMQQELAENHLRYASQHFNVRYPKMTGEKYARQVSIVLEEEWKRLQRWIPLRSSRLLDVDLFPVLEFLESYSENVLGVYDGRIRVPLADLRSLHPQLVAVLSHELAHAMIAERTRDRAPMWFHEGLAQHVQMVHHNANPVGDLISADRMLSLSVVETALNGFVEPQFVEISYSLAVWFLHFIETEFGRPAIADLMRAFAGGANTDEAMVAALGITTAQFDSRFRNWALRKAPAAWTADLRRYDTEAAVAELLGEGHRSSTQKRAPRRAKRTTDREMNSWYRQYASRFGTVKSALMQVVAALQASDAAFRLKFACGQLATEVARATADQRLMGSPDQAVTRRVGTALEELDSLSEVCLATQGGPRTQAQMKTVEGALVKLAASLEPWGLQP